MSTTEMKEEQVMPLWVFARHRDREIETGLILAGKLHVDIPKTTKLKKRHHRLIKEIHERLLDMLRDGYLSDYAVIHAWPKGQRPANHNEIVDNDELMAAWAKERLCAEIAIAPKSPASADDEMDFIIAHLRNRGMIPPGASRGEIVEAIKASTVAHSTMKKTDN